MEDFINRVNLVAALDHSGRAGNNFFLSIFDQHPEVLTCNWVHYIYSYVVAEFGDAAEIDGAKAYEFLIYKSYFRFTFQDPNPGLEAQLVRFGGNPSASIDRKRGRDLLAQFVGSKKTVKRRELILAAYFAYAVSTNRDTAAIKYILVSDAVSLREEDVLAGFGGRVMRAMYADFPQVRFVSLVRDPRANFASCRQQFVNQNGNMYGYRCGSYFAQLADLYARKLTTEGCVYVYWLAYFASAARTIERLKKQYATNFITVRNENLNTRFVETLHAICGWLGVVFLDAWNVPNFEPTSAGKPWRGTGAYNSRYQTKIYGMLENDPPSVADKVTGPNEYVTQRWRKRLTRSEIEVIDILFEREMRELGYAGNTAGEPDRDKRLLRNLLVPFQGELPSLAWIAKGRHISPGEVFQRIFYAFTFAPFYVLSRIVLLGLVRSGHFNRGADTK